MKHIHFNLSSQISGCFACERLIFKVAYFKVSAYRKKVEEIETKDNI